MLVVYECKISLRYLEKLPMFDILKVENVCFSRCSLEFLYFLIFKMLSDLGRQKCSMVIFRVLDEKMT